MEYITEAKYILEFLDTYYRYGDTEKGKREAECLRVQHKYAIKALEDGDLFLGRYEIPCVGFALQDQGMGFNMSEGRCADLLEKLPQEWRGKLAPLLKQWKRETGYEQLLSKTPAEVLEIIPSDQFQAESGVGFWLCRMSSTHLDMDKLLRLGIPGIREEIGTALRNTDNAQARVLYEDMLLALDVLCDVILYHAERVLQSRNPNRERIGQVLRNITVRAPEHLDEAIQLMYLYALISGTYNYGRMDEYLGDFLQHDLESGVCTRQQAKDLLCSLWQLFNQRMTTWDGRVIIGGMGRRNEKNADLCALLIMEVAAEVREVLPQLTLRFHAGQDPALMEMALQNIGSGYVYPMLYNDDVNIPSVEKAFDVTYEEAVQYVPYGCGEYILYHRSVGTPSDIINLLKALEITIFNGYDHLSQKQIGLKTGEFESFENFEAFFEAYCRQVERYVDAGAQQEKAEYCAAQEHASFLFASILYDDCIGRGKAIFDGGVRYLGGTLETYGNTNTADSLTAIKKLVFEEQTISRSQLKEMLLNNFEGFETERELLLNAPKYGNDDVQADAMALRVHRHICQYTRSRASEVGLDSYLVVVINNSANTTTGRRTLASADGRRAYEPMANANNPSGGSDKNGLTAFLNSLVKLPTDIHAGSVQNIKFSKEMFTTYYEKTKAMIQVYFDKGGSQLMANVLGRGDLENALKYPEKYRNLIVRVGGFCARFVELNPAVQREILSRTMY